VRGSVARGTLLGLAGQAWHLVTAFLLYAFLARQLGPATFGEWRVVLSVLNWFEIVLNSGLVKAATQVIAEAPERTSRIGRATYAGQIAAAIGVFVVMILMAGPIASSLSDPELATLIRISALDLPVYGLFLGAMAVLFGTHRYDRQVVSSIVYATAKLVAIGVLVAVGFSVQGALIGNAIASVVGLAAAFVPLGRRSEHAEPMAPVLRAMAMAAVSFLALDLLEGLGASADLWVVSALVVNATMVGWYASASVLAEVPKFLFAGLNRVLFPSVASAKAEGDERLASHYAVQAVRLGLMVTIFGVAVIAATGRQALTLLYSDAYAGAYVPLAVLMVAAMGRVVRTSCTEVLMARGRRRVPIIILVVSVALEVVLLVALAARFGIVGAAVAVAIAAIVAGLWASFTLRDMLGWRPVYTLVRTGLAAAIVGVALFWIAPSPLGILVAYPVASVAYAGLLVLLREISQEDVGSVRTALGR